MFFGFVERRSRTVYMAIAVAASFFVRRLWHSCVRWCLAHGVQLAVGVR